MIAAAVFAAAAVAISLARQTGPAFTPEAASASFTKALLSARFDEAADLSSRGLVDQVIRVLCEPEYEAARRVYQELIPALAEPEWRTLRRKAERRAGTEWEQLREKIDRLGREALQDLNDEETGALLADTAMFKEFVFCKGWDALSQEDKDKAGGSRDALLQRNATEEFILRIGWQALSSDEREDLGSPEALSRTDTAAKLAYFDRIGKPQLGPQYEEVVVERARSARPGRELPSTWRLEGCELEENVPPPIPAQPATPERREKQAVSPDYRELIKGIERDDISSPEVFATRHGERIARERLERTTTTEPKSAKAGYLPWELGSVFWRSAAVPSVRVVIANEPSSLTFRAVKAGIGWRVTSVDGLPLDVIVGG